jgi:hypothetical protein
MYVLKATDTCDIIKAPNSFATEEASPTALAPNTFDLFLDNVSWVVGFVFGPIAALQDLAAAGM